MTNEPLLVLRLEAPLQSWGLRARWDVRDTGSDPSKSGIMGLLACALGYSQGDTRIETELDANLQIGIRVELPGVPATDFHTITGSLPQAGGGVKGTKGEGSTVISPRQYLHDASFLTIIAGPSELLERCADALASPNWPLYLGRKACVPTRPVLEGLTREYSSLEEALQQYLWYPSGIGGKRRKGPAPAQLRCLVEDPAGRAVRPDRVFINPARMYRNRQVREFWVKVPVGTQEES